MARDDTGASDPSRESEMFGERWHVGVGQGLRFRPLLSVAPVNRLRLALATPPPARPPSRCTQSALSGPVPALLLVMAEPTWQETLRLRLVERNARESSYAPIIEQCTSMLLGVLSLDSGFAPS